MSRCQRRIPDNGDYLGCLNDSLLNSEFCKEHQPVNLSEEEFINKLNELMINISYKVKDLDIINILLSHISVTAIELKLTEEDFLKLCKEYYNIAVKG